MALDVLCARQTHIPRIGLRRFSPRRRHQPIPFFRRGDIEALFGLKRRQAINLMHAIGAIRVSQEIAVRQKDLVDWLEKLAANPARIREIGRQQRVIERIVELKAETAART